MPAGVAYILQAADAGLSANTTIIDARTGEIVCAAGSLHGVRSVRSLTLTCNVTVSPGVALRASPPTHTAAAAVARPYPDLPTMRLPGSSTRRWVQQQHIRDAAAGAAAALAPGAAAVRMWVPLGTQASRLCIAPHCSHIAYYGARGDAARHCGSHKVTGEGNVYFPCQVTSCTDTARFAPPGERPARCALHKAEGDENVRAGTCEAADCALTPGGTVFCIYFFVFCIYVRIRSILHLLANISTNSFLEPDLSTCCPNDS